MIKTMIHNRLLLSVLGCMILLGGMACEEEDTKLYKTTFTEKLTGDSSKSWRRTERRLVVETRTGTDTFNLEIGLPPCERDNIHTFYKEGNVFEFSEGRTKCNSDDEDVFARGFWEINNANATFILGGNEPYELVKLTEDELVYGFETSVPLSGEIRPVQGFLIYTYVPD